MDIVSEIARHIRHYNGQIAFALVVTLLVIFGGEINRTIRKLVAGWNVMLRVLVFVIFCALGYGLLASWLTGFLQGQLRGLSNTVYLVVVIGSFVVLGWLAERGRWR